jgi:hypothetical protein
MRPWFFVCSVSRYFEHQRQWCQLNHIPKERKFKWVSVIPFKTPQCSLEKDSHQFCFGCSHLSACGLVHLRRPSTSAATLSWVHWSKSSAIDRFQHTLPSDGHCLWKCDLSRFLGAWTKRLFRRRFATFLSSMNSFDSIQLTFSSESLHWLQSKSASYWTRKLSIQPKLTKQTGLANMPLRTTLVDIRRELADDFHNTITGIDPSEMLKMVLRSSRSNRSTCSDWAPRKCRRRLYWPIGTERSH